MGLRYKNQDLGECFFVTTSFRDHAPFGHIRGVYENLAEALNFRLAKTCSKLAAYVLMPTHIHFLIFIDGRLLSPFMRDFKKYTAQKGLSDLCGASLIWQYRYDRQVIVSQKILLTKMNYIHYNPVKAGLVTNPEDWFWSSATCYCRENALSPIPVWTEWYHV